MILLMNLDSSDTTKYLQDRYKEGFIPGPSESFEAFEKRVTLVKSLIGSPEAFLKRLGIDYQTITPITPYFLTITTKKGLPFWFGAMTLICELDGQKIPIIELPKKRRGFDLSHED